MRLSDSVLGQTVKCQIIVVVVASTRWCERNLTGTSLARVTPIGPSSRFAAPQVRAAKMRSPKTHKKTLGLNRQNGEES